MDLRASLISSINLAQMSEFSLVIASLGLALKHISSELVGTLTLSSRSLRSLSTYLIAYNHEIQRQLARLLEKIGFATGGDSAADVAEQEEANSIVFLGCFHARPALFSTRWSCSLKAQTATAFLARSWSSISILWCLQELKRRGIKCLYGDVAHYGHSTPRPHSLGENRRLHYLGCHSAGTTNLRLLRQARRLCPDAQVIAAADNIAMAIELYEQGADFVYVARLHSARHMAELIARAVQNENELKEYREDEFRLLKRREEVLQ